MSRGETRRALLWALVAIPLSSQALFGQGPSPATEEDEGFISFDRSRKKLVLRQFHVDGFVNQYAEDSGTTPDRLSFTSEQIENIPPGWQARETYIKRGSDTFEEVFELEEPGKPFEVYSHARFTRVP